MQISLRSLLTIPFFLQIVGITSLVGYLSYRSGQQAVEEMAHQLMAQAAQRVEQRLTTYLGNAQRDLARSQLTLAAGQLDPDDLQALQQYFFRVLQLDDSYIALGYGSASGKSLVVGWDEDLAETAASGYIAAKTEDPQIGNNTAYRLNNQGQPVEVLQTVSDYDPRQLIWYQTAAEQEQSAWTPIYPLVLKPFPAMLAVTPLRQNDQLEGVLFATVPMSRVSQFLGAIDFAPRGQIFIIESDGDLVATSTQEQVYVVETEAESQPLVRVNARQSQNPLTQTTTQVFLEQIESLPLKEPWQWEFDAPRSTPEGFSQQHYFASAIPYEDAYGLEWTIVTVVPRADFMGQIQQNVKRTALLCGVALVGTVGFSLWLTQRILQPLKALNQATQKFAADAVPFDTQPTIIQEVESLRQTFLRMTQRLDESFRDLKASEQQFAILLENVPVGVGVINAQGEVVCLNSVARQLHGVTTIAPHPSQLSAAYQIYRAGSDKHYPLDELPALRALQGEQVTVDDVEIQSATTGQRRPVKVYATPVRNSAGAIIYAIVAFQDISEQREIEHIKARYQEELEQEVTLKTAALDEAQRIAQVGSWELDVGTGQSQWTDTLYNLIGREPGSTSPRFDDILAATHPDDRPLLQQTLQTTIDQGVSYELEHRMIGPDGTLRYRVSRGEPVFNDRGEVVSVIGTISDITARKQIELKLLKLQAQLQIQASVDSLTQVANRYQLDTVLAQEWRRCQRNQAPIAIFMIDIDYFKAYNDRYGHLQGDRCLQQVAQILQGCVNRASDLVARYGGEEFTLVLPQTDAHGAIQIAEQIQQEMRLANIPHAGTQASDRLTLSLGITVITQVTTTTPSEALRMADQALYSAKQHRNCFRLTQI